MKKPAKRNRKRRAKPCIGSQQPAYVPPQKPPPSGALAMVRADRQIESK